MRSVVLAGPRQIKVEDVARPTPGRGEACVRMEGSGVCGSDLPPWQGQPWLQYPFEPGAPGHEGWGVVDAVGSGVSSVAPGDRVAGLFHRAFAEYDVAKADTLVPVPDALRGEAAPGEPLACAFNAFARSDVREDHTVAVVGVGFLGAVIARLAVEAGARVIAINRRPDGLEAARRMGARELVPLDDHRKAIERVSDLTGGDLCDRVIECAGAQWPLDLAAEITRTRGRLVIAGYHQEGPRQVNMQLWNWRGLDVVNAHERDPAAYVRGMQEAFAAVAAGRLDVRPLITHSFRLEDAAKAFETLDARPHGFTKAVIAAD